MNFELNRNLLENIFSCFGWIVIWFSIGITPDYLINYKFSLSFELFNFLRGVAPLIYCILLMCYLIFKFKDRFDLKKNIILILILIYFFFQLTGIFYNLATLKNIYYLVLGLCTVILIITYIFNDFNPNYFKYISVIFIFILFLNFLGPQIKNFLHTPLTFYQQWGIASEKGTFINSLNISYIYPNILGFSRYTFVLFLFLFFLKKNNLFLNIIKIFLVSIIFLLQARATILIYLLFILLHPFLYEKFNYRTYLKKIFLFIILPVIIFLLANMAKTEFFFKKELILRNDIEVKHFEEKGAVVIRPVIEGNYTSDRIKDWKMFIHDNKKKIFGKGPQADRVIYNKTASNAWIYALVCSGLFGFIFFLILTLYSIYLSLKFSLLYRNQEHYYSHLYHPTICLTFLARAFFETSFGVFGIDFILFFFSLFTIQKCLKSEK